MNENKPIPPKLAEHLLTWFLKDELTEEVLGDLEEKFYKTAMQRSVWRAKLNYWYQVLHYLRPFAVRNYRSSSNFTIMLRHNFILTYRNFAKYRWSFFINLIGLSIGIMVSFLMFRYISFERSYDDFHAKKDRIFRVGLEISNHNEKIKSAQNYPVTGPALKSDFSEIENFVRLYSATSGYNTCTITKAEKENTITLNQKKVFYADNSFFKVFSFPMISGNEESALSDPNTCILSQSKAQQYFGKENPVGQTLEISFDGDKSDFVVTGVFKDLPYNTHLDFDFLLSYSTLTDESYRNSWYWNEFYTYILLDQGANFHKLESKFDKFISSYMADKHKKFGMSEHFFLQPLQDIHLKSHLPFELADNGDGKMINLLTWMASFILLFARINYLNLSLSLLFRRTKEVGIKKALGANRANIINQIIIEFTLLTALAFLISTLLLITLLPKMQYFGEVFQHMTLNLGSLSIFFAAVIMGTIIFALIPGLYLSNIKPITTLKGSYIKFSKGLNLRKASLLIQFAASIIILVGVLTVFLQIRMLKSEPLNMSMENDLILHAPNYSYDDTTYYSIYQSFKNELLAHSNITKITSTSTIPGAVNNWSLTGVIRKPGVDRTDAKTYYFIESDSNFIDFFDFKILAGNDFMVKSKSAYPNIIINDKARDELGFTDAESAIGEKIIMEQNGDHYEYSTIVGVIDNYKQEYGKKALLPTIFWTQNGINLNYCVKLKSVNDFQNTLQYIKLIWGKFYPSHEFSYFFQKDFYNRQYTSELRFARLIAAISILALIIVCLGIYGIFILITSSRFKEIGIRKILGASRLSLGLILSKDLFYLIIISNIIGLPIAIMLVNGWLNNYASRITLDMWLYLTPTILLFILTSSVLINLLYRSVTKNPVLAIRNE